MLTKLITLGLAILPLCNYVHGQSGGSILDGLETSRLIQKQQLSSLTSNFMGPENLASTKPPQTITFSNPAAKKFAVDGTKIPLGKYHQEL